MIYTLEYDYHNGMYETDWLDTLKRTGLEYKTLVNEMLTGEGAISNKRYLESNIDYLQSILTEDDYLLMDSAYINENINAHSMSTNDVYKLIKEKLKYKKLIIFHPDNGEPLVGDDVEFINPQYNIDWDSDKYQSHYNIYINNTGKNKNRWLNMLISQRFRNMLRYKHFQFTNGVFKEHRTLLYGYLKKDGYLDKCFSSYVAYNLGNKIPTYDEHFESLKPNRLTNDDYNELINDLPLILDCDWSGNVDQDSTVIPYSSNSYFHLVGCTNFKGYNGERFNDTYTSEKIFKPYLSWQIPIFFGEAGLYKSLDKLGFDTFSDTFDLSFDNEPNDLKRFELQYQNVLKIAKLSRREVHSMYRDRFERIENNFKQLEKLSDGYVESFKKMLV
jgi:hypothetical protein